MNPSEAPLIGMPKDKIDTPALLIDLDALDSNIARMAEYFSTRHARLRPHFKTHKCPIISRKQMAAGAAGITCAKIEEAEALVAGGVVSNILVAYQIVTKHKIAKLMGLSRHANLTVCVDDPQNIGDLSDAAKLFGTEIGVLVEVNVGQNRAGVDSPDRAVELARQIAASPGLRFMGLQGYEGHLVFTADPDQRRAAVERDLARVLSARKAVEEAGIEVKGVDSAGTGTFDITGNLPGIDYVQPGSYVFMDANYLRIRQDFQPALFLLATVISRPIKTRAVLDCGMKAASVDQMLPQVWGMEGAKTLPLSEEHCTLELDNPSRDLRLGDRVEMLPGHGCTTVNLHERYYGIRNNLVEAVWEIPARGKFR